MKINWPNLNFPPINLWSVWKMSKWSRIDFIGSNGNDGLHYDSPCIGVCKLNDTGEYCIGCLRTLEEIKQKGEEWKYKQNLSKE